MYDGGEVQVAANAEVIFEYVNDKGQTTVAVGPQDGYAFAMQEARWSANALRTCDGKVVFVGGLSGSVASPQNVYSAELFNPETP